MSRRLYKNAVSAVALIWSSKIWDDDAAQIKKTMGEEAVVAYFSVLFGYLAG